MTEPPAAARARGALVGLAVGDALGMPTQSWPRERIVERYGPVLTGLEPGAPDQPIAPGLPAGTVTDDTEQALLVARLLVEGRGVLDERELGARLLAWEAQMRARGSLDLLGPSTRRALDALAAGVPPERTGATGTTNGAAMRIAGVAIATPADADLLVDAVVAASRLTHGTGVALAGAAAVAGAVSAGVGGSSPDEAVDLACRCAQLAQRRGHWVAAPQLAARIRWAVAHTAGLDDEDLLTVLADLVGTSLAAVESVPAAFALAMARLDDPWRALRLAAGAGGDTDTIGAMAGAVLGAVHGPGVVPAPVRDQVERVNGLDLAAIADELLALRGGAGLAPRGARPQAHVPCVVYVGQAVVDVVVPTPRLPARGGDVLAEPPQEHAGGGVNTMLAAARLGCRVVYAGRHGTGPHGDRVRRELLAAGVGLLLPPTPGGDTGTVLVLVEPDGERTFVTSPGAEATLTADDLAAGRPGAHDLVVVSGYALAHESNRAAVLAWLPTLPASVRVVVDPGPLDVPVAARDALLARADWVTATTVEAAAWAGQPGPAGPGRAEPAAAPDPQVVGRVLAARTRAGAVVRLGADGCLVVPRDGRPVLLSAPAVPVVDLTGAGDAHTGAFVAALLAGDDAVGAARRATVAAALAVGRHGPATGPTAAQLDRALAAAGGGAGPDRTASAGPP